MTTKDAQGAVTICERGRAGLYADDLGVTVRRSSSSATRFRWAQIDRFADGRQLTHGGYCWVLVIVLHSGRRIPVSCTQRMGEADPETLTAIRQVADRHEIPADLTGVPMTDDGRPVSTGLYKDPGGRAALRYWDGRQWSPLLPLHLKKAGWGWDRTKGKSAGFSSDFPVADGRWTYAAVGARRWALWLAFFAVVTAALLAVGLTIRLGWDHGSSHRYVDPRGWFIAAGIAVVIACVIPGRAWTFYHKLDKASRASVDR
jgi:Protein of unknown function (DUF2510)